ncbi:MAG: substrate-binding domain-containing protein [Synergistaceae bacterium]|nr:substrate-binding domain-containing protein [Synergistaceae bacterium]
MRHIKYYMSMGAFMFIGVPLVADLSLFLGMLAGGVLSPVSVAVVILLPVPVVMSLAWRFCVKRPDIPETAHLRLLPAFAAFFYYMAVWIAAFGLSGYNADSGAFGVFYAMAMPYFFVNILLSFAGELYFFPILQAAILLANIAIHQAVCVFCKKSASANKHLLHCAWLAILLCALSGYQFYDRNSNTIFGAPMEDGIEDEVDLGRYRPFDEDNLLAVLPDAPEIEIGGEYPIIDGATAAYPVYAAAAQAVYSGLDEDTVGDYVQCSRTADAYNSLIDGEIDIFFGAQPSKQQVEAARAKGVEFELTPIGKEAFVFFVNRENPVGDLTIWQIQDIYQKKIRNWGELGGRNEKITPFQRPDGSGSQTVMLARAMGGKKLPPPLREEYAADMGGMVNKVAVYRNYSSAIGYSFRYFVEGMKKNSGVKLIAVDGTAPTVQNIKNGSYPFTIDFYAVTAGTRNENAQKLIGWLLSGQGQDLIERCGCVGL